MEGAATVRYFRKKSEGVNEGVRVTIRPFPGIFGWSVKTGQGTRPPPGVPSCAKGQW